MGCVQRTVQQSSYHVNDDSCSCASRLCKKREGRDLGMNEGMNYTVYLPTGRMHVGCPPLARL